MPWTPGCNCDSCKWHRRCLLGPLFETDWHYEEKERVSYGCPNGRSGREQVDIKANYAK